MDTKILPQNPQAEEILIFDVASIPTFMYSDNRFWISLTTTWKWLGPIERAFLLACELRILLNDKDGGTFIPLDDFLKVSPNDVQTILRAQRDRFTAMMKGGE